jgi:outer membrane biosynthesis protein TonB
MISNNYSSLEDFEKPEDKQKGRIGAITFVILVLALLIIPWFTTTYPIPEAEGLMASFGDVELAGGSEDFVKPAEPTPPQPEPVKVDPVVEKVDEVETIENNEDPIVDKKPDPTPTPPTPTPEPTPTPTPPKPDPGSLFPGNGKTNGKGTGTGDGVQGTPDGKGDLGGTGNGDKGKGKGKIGSRRNVSKCEDYQTGSTSWQEKGTAVVTICVDARGKVVNADFNRRKSTITSQSLINLAVGCAQEYRYEKAPGSPEACGDITIQFGER